MRSIVLEDNRNSRRYWIYTLIISTYCMNKRGFHCALLRAVFPLILLLPYLHSSLFFSSILSRLLAFPFFFVPLQVSNPLSFAFLSLTSLSSTPLHYEDQLRTAPQKRTFILLGSLPPKNLHYNFLIHLFKACFTPHENMRWVPSEFCLIFVALT